MLTSGITAVLTVSAILACWLVVQRSWAAVSGKADEDALSGRLGCQGCGCEKACNKQSS